LIGVWEEQTMHRRADEQHEREAELDELEPASSAPDSESGGQSGDTQALFPVSDVANESVRELAEDGQPYEAGIVAGVEDAGNNPERPVRSHEEQRPTHESELSADPDWK
jgi:hypothetical protein